MDDEYQVHWVSFLDGRQRVLLFTEDVAVIAKARQAEEMEQIQQEISVSLHNLGLSLINNRNKKEIAYVGITRYTQIWPSEYVDLNNNTLEGNCTKPLFSITCKRERKDGE